MRSIVSCLVALLCLGTATAFATAQEPTTDEQKTVYALGLAISQSLGTFSLSEAELDLVKSGITDGVLKKTPKVDLQTFGPKIQQLQCRAAAVADAERRQGLHSSRKPQQNPAPKNRVRRNPYDHQGREGRDPESHGYREGALSRHSDRWDGIRQFRQAGRAGHVRIEPSDQMLDGGGPADESRQQE